jgi:hypothetical protein
VPTRKFRAPVLSWSPFWFLALWGGGRIKSGGWPFCLTIENDNEENKLCFFSD